MVALVTIHNLYTSNMPSTGLSHTKTQEISFSIEFSGKGIFIGASHSGTSGILATAHYTLLLEEKAIQR